MNNILNYTNRLIQEGYIFSDKTISIDLDKFESGESNKLFIIGLSGGGKTTLGKHLAKKYKAKYIDTDDILGDSDEIRIKELKVVLNNNKKMIIGGALIIKSYHRDYLPQKLLMNTPVIILGKSILKSTLDAFIRNVKDKRENRQGKISKDPLKKLKVNIKKLQPMFINFREDRIKAGGNLQEFKVPKL